MNGVRYSGAQGNRQALQEALNAAAEYGLTVFTSWKDSDGKYHPNHPDESTSGRSYRRGVIEGSRRWRWSMKVIDWLFSPWEQDHCRKAQEADIRRARYLIQGTKG